MKHFVVSVLLLITTQLSAQIQISSEPSWKIPFKENFQKPNSKDIDGGYYEILFEEQIHVELEEEFTHIIRKIESNEGVQNGSQISVNFEPSYQKLTFHKLIIRRNGQEINKLQIKNFKVESNEQELSKFIYNGTKNAFMILEDVRKGDEIDFSYTIKGRNPIFNKIYFSGIYTYVTSPFSQLYQNIIFSKNRKLTFKENSNIPKAVISEKNGMVVYEWMQILPKPHTFEDYVPSWFDDTPNVQISEMQTWEDVNNWALPLYQVDGKLPKELQTKVSEFKRKAGGDIHKFMELATRFVQDEIRYMGIEVGVNSHRPNSPEKVFSQRFGDCKDKALLLSNMLKANGIEAYPALVSTYKKHKIKELLPSPFNFNHVVVFVKIDKENYWIDATISNQRGKIATQFMPYYGEALVIRPKEKSLITIPKTYIGSNQVVEKYTIPEIGKDGVLEVKSDYSISFADDARGRFASSSMSEIEKSYTNFYAGLFPNNQVELLDSLQYRDDDYNNSFTTTEHYSIKNIWSLIDSVKKSYEIEIFGNVLKEKFRFLKNKSSVRKSPISIEYPFESDYTLEIHLPSDWTVTEEKFSINRPAYIFNFSSEYKNKVWVLNYHYKALQDFVPADKISEYKADLTKIEDSLGRSLTWSLIDESEVSTVNWWMVVLGFLSFCAFVFVAFLYFQTSKKTIEMPDEILPIGGWLVLVGIGVAVSPFLILYTIFTNNYFDSVTWNALDSLSTNVFLFKVGVVLEMLSNIFLFSFSLLIIVLFFKQRDILPQTIIAFYVFSIIQAIFELGFSYGFSDVIAQKDINVTGIELGKTFFRAIIWIPYFRLSQRVKNTFVKPFE